MAASETPTQPAMGTSANGAVSTSAPSAGLMGGIASGLVGRVRMALGGRDHKSEVAGYRLALADAGQAQVGWIVEQLLELAETPVGIEALTAVAGVFDRLEPAK